MTHETRTLRYLWSRGRIMCACADYTEKFGTLFQYKSSRMSIKNRLLCVWSDTYDIEDRVE